MAPSNTKSELVGLLSRLLLLPTSLVAPTLSDEKMAELAVDIKRLLQNRPDHQEDFLTLATKNHVVLRALQTLCIIVTKQDQQLAECAESAIAKEQARINHALPILEQVCDGLGAEGCDVTVIKTLDHWPDFGSDLDLYSNAKPEAIVGAMTRRFQAKLEPRSWGDRLACKWNFMVPGLPEAIEIHVGRLGQTGEHVAWPSSVPKHSIWVQRGSCRFTVASPEDRLMISTLQRMYRHFYFRLCDIVDSAQLVETEVVDFAGLRLSAEACGIWKGVATYLCIVSDYVERYRGEEVPLPDYVRSAAQFGGNQLTYARDFLRIPIVPHSAELYAAELTKLALNGDLKETFRLSLLPYLAAAAAVGQKLTGSDKGIW